MVSEAGEQNLFCIEICFQEFSHRKHIVLMFFHPDHERLDSPLDKAAIKGRRHTSGGILIESALFVNGIVAGDEATAGHIAVSGQVFSRAVDDNICAQIKRGLKI